jgi:hypothetical protein
MGNHRRLFVSTRNRLTLNIVDTRRGKKRWLFPVCLLLGCSAGTRPLPPVVPEPVVPSPPGVTPPVAGTWTFNYAPGTARYRISRSAAIESQSDSTGSKRETSTNVTNELLSLMAAGDSGFSFTVIVDTFSTTGQGLIGPAPVIQLPVQVTGFLTAQTLTISGDTSTSIKCNPVFSTLVSDLRNLLPRFPAELSPGKAWRDSVDASGCQAGIPTTSRTTSAYVMAGEANYEGRPVLVIQRSDIIQAHGEGSQQQHSVKLDASGTGNALYYIDRKDSRITRITAGQELNLTISTSGKLHQFKQNSKQEFRIAP